MSALLTSDFGRGESHERWIKLGLFALWLTLAVTLAAHHAIWRDEMRALSIALDGEHLTAMLRGLHGEGHPALWYIMLRGAYAVFGRPEVLPGVALSVAVAAQLLLVWRAPFGWPAVALILFSGFGLFEYVVMARNYGISMLLLFAIAAAFPRHRGQGVLLGILLFLLANSNVHSALLACAFLFFWAADLLIEQGLRPTPQMRVFLVNAAIALLGVAACVLTIYPPLNDAAAMDPATRPDAWALLQAYVYPVGAVPGLQYFPWLELLSPVIVYGSLLALVRRPAAMMAAAGALIGFILLFNLVYPGDYRHQCLWLVFLIALAWIAHAPDTAARSGWRENRAVKAAASAGSGLFLLLLLLQFPVSLYEVDTVARGGPPRSRSRDLGAMMAAHPELGRATIIGDPDYLVEPLPYYLGNPTFLVREARDGPIVRFTRSARLSISLDDMLASARMLAARSAQPVIILMHTRLDGTLPAGAVAEGYNWQLQVDAASIARFRQATRLIARFAPASTDESFDAYLFSPPVSESAMAARSENLTGQSPAAGARP